jgi:hypothetical protein
MNLPTDAVCIRRLGCRIGGRTRRGPAEAGTVLLETVLALTLFVAAAAVIAGAVNASLNGVERLRLDAHAADLAVTVLSELQLGLRSTGNAGPQAFDPPFEDWSWEVLSETLIGETGMTTGLTQVEVVVRHEDPPVVRRLGQVVRLPATALGEEEFGAMSGF